MAIDPRIFAARLAQAKANLRAARAQYHATTLNVQVVDTTTAAAIRQATAGVLAARRMVDGARSRLAQAQAQVVVARADAHLEEIEAARYERLYRIHAVSQEERDTARAARRTATAQLDAARRAAQAALESFRQAQAQLARAQAAPSQVAYSRAQAKRATAEIAQLEAAVR